MDKRPHPILSQIPLVISPKLRPPQAVTLPFNFDKLPNQVPASSVSVNTLQQIQADTEGFVRALDQRHMSRVNAYREWRDQVNQQEIQEKRRIAPGYLDSGSRLLIPVAVDEKIPSSTPARPEETNDNRPENELDQVFGRVSLGDHQNAASTT